VLSESIKQVNNRLADQTGTLQAPRGHEPIQQMQVQMQMRPSESRVQQKQDEPELRQQEQRQQQRQQQQQQQQQQPVRPEYPDPAVQPKPQQIPRGHVTFAIKQDEIFPETAAATAATTVMAMSTPGILPETASRELPHRPHRRPRSTITVLNSPRRARDAAAAAGISSAESAGIPQSYDFVPFSGADVTTNLKHPLGVSSPRHPAGILPGDNNDTLARVRSPRRGAGSMVPATESEADMRHMLWVGQAIPGGRGGGAGGAFNADFAPKQRLVLPANTEEERQAMIRRINRWLRLSGEARRRTGDGGGGGGSGNPTTANRTFSGMADDLPPAIMRRHRATTTELAGRRNELARVLEADKRRYEEARKKKARMRLGGLPFRVL
jgi:hypothetical protein